MCGLRINPRADAVSAARWRPLWFVPALVLAAAFHLATATYFEAVRVFDSATPRTPVAGIVRLDGLKGPDGERPTVLILRITNRGGTSTRLAVVAGGFELAAATVPAASTRRRPARYIASRFRRRSRRAAIASSWRRRWAARRSCASSSSQCCSGPDSG